MAKSLAPTMAFAMGLALLGLISVGFVPAAQSAAAAGWSALSPAGTAPAARSQHSAIYDPVGDRVVVFGGINDDGRLSDVWSLSLAGSPTWTPLSPAGTAPAARYDHSAIYDPDGRRMVVFGGNALDAATNTVRYLNDLWALSLDGTPEWTQLSPTGPGPSGRAGQTAVYDPEQHRMLLFGGASGPNSPYYNDVWALSLTGPLTWTQLDATAIGLPKLTQHSAALTPDRQLLVFGGAYEAGGSAPPGLSQAAWLLDLSETPTWTMLSPAGDGPSARIGQSAVYDPAGKRLLIFGGYQPYSYEVFDELWALSTGDQPAWSRIATDTAPPARLGQAAAWDSERGRMIVFGGEQRSPLLTYLNDVWAFSTGSSPDASTTPSPSPEASSTPSPSTTPAETATTPIAMVTPPSSTATPVLAAATPATATPVLGASTATPTASVTATTVPSQTPWSGSARPGVRQIFLPATFRALER